MTLIPMLREAGVECYSRAEWGSPQERAGAYSRRSLTHPMPSGPANYHFLHITVTPDTDTVQQGSAGARQVETYGLSTPPMVSYQDLVTNEGKYFEGQSYGVKGTHTINDKRVPGFPHDLNLYGYATAIMQNVGDAVTDEQVRVIAMVFAARELTGLVKRGAPVHPHRTFAAKSCPGDLAVDHLDEIVELKDRYVREGLPGTKKTRDNQRASLRRHLRLAALAVTSGKRSDLRRHLRSAALLATALRKPVLAGRLWATRAKWTNRRAKGHPPTAVAVRLWEFRRKHTS